MNVMGKNRGASGRGPSSGVLALLGAAVGMWWMMRAYAPEVLGSFSLSRFLFSLFSN